jgi:hypothetical protein
MKSRYKILYLLSLFFVGFKCAEEESKESNIPSLNIEATKVKAQEALDFCKVKNFNTDFCILIDMSLHSGVSRFVVWDFKNDSVMHRFLVGHGCGESPWSEDQSKENPIFSNEDNSHCSSLGKYKIGQRGFSNWGVNVKYLLQGLESTNSNALKRVIVFHSWEVISDDEVYPSGTPEGWGCPAVSNNSFRIVDPLLRASSKPVLMWIYK